MDAPKAEEHMLKGTTVDTLEDTSKAYNHVFHSASI